MDEQEIRRRQREGVQKHKELGTHEYRKQKAEKRRQYYEAHEKPIRDAVNAGAVLATEQGVPVLKPQKKRGCSVTLMIVDESGEFAHTWEAPALSGTVMPSQRGRGYLDMARPVLEKIYGKLR